MINRAAVIIRYKQPAVKWLNKADPVKDNPGITLASANEENTIFLISQKDAETPDRLLRWLRKNYKQLFKVELENWYVDTDLWPKKLTFDLFNQWFAIECHTVIEDSLGSPIEDDGL